MESAELTKDTFACIQERIAPSATALIQQTKKKYFLPFVRFLLDWNGSTTQLSPSVPNNSMSSDTSSSSQQNNSSSNYSALGNQDEDDDGDDNCFASGKGVDVYAERANGLTDGNENEREEDTEFNKFEILLPEPNRTAGSSDHHHHYHLVKNDSTDLTEILFTHFDLFSGVPINNDKAKEENNYYFHSISFDSVDEDQQDLLKDQKATDKDHFFVRGTFQATELNPFPLLKRDRKRKFAFLESIQEEFENEIYF
jgi:hypothetical protein